MVLHSDTSELCTYGLDNHNECWWFCPMYSLAEVSELPYNRHGFCLKYSCTSPAGIINPAPQRCRILDPSTKAFQCFRGFGKTNQWTIWRDWGFQHQCAVPDKVPSSFINQINQAASRQSNTTGAQKDRALPRHIMQCSPLDPLLVPFTQVHLLGKFCTLRGNSSLLLYVRPSLVPSN